jgi:hypothetical protein
VFAAIEAAAKVGTAFVNRAASLADIDAVAAIIRGEGEDRIASGAVFQNLELVGFDVIAVLRVQNKGLITPAAFGAARTGYFRVTVR